MLLNLMVQDVVLIKTLNLDFKEGLVVFTGETGAGKSIILDAVSLLLGGRSDRSFVRVGADKALVSGLFRLKPDHIAFSYLKEAGYNIDIDDDLLLKRIISIDGRSRAFINDQPASIAVLKTIGETLVEIHGQYDGQGFLNTKNYQVWLDDFGRRVIKQYPTILKETEDSYKELKSTEGRLENLKKNILEAQAEQEYILQSLKSLQALDFKVGEEEKLSKERSLLNKAEKIISELDRINKLISAEAGCENILSETSASLTKVVDSIEDKEMPLYHFLQSAATSSGQALIEIRELLAQIDEAHRALIFDSEYLDEIEERLFSIRAEARKHNIAPEALGELLKALKNKAETFEQGDLLLKNVEKEFHLAQKAYQKAAHLLSEIRKQCAQILDRGVMKEFEPLKLEKACFRTAIKDKPNPVNLQGADEIIFEISTNPGTPFGALNVIASGGELSRVALAIKVVLSEDKNIMIFDEVDQGVGGAVATAIGRRLKRLSETNQVFIVTHSPQIAAFARQHYHVQKKTIHDTETQTSALELNPKKHIEEIARMLSGNKVTHEARAAALQLIEENIL